MIADDFRYPWPPVEPGERRFKRERNRAGQALYYRYIPGQVPVFFRVRSGLWEPSIEFRDLNALMNYTEEVIPSALMVSEGL